MTGARSAAPGLVIGVSAAGGLFLALVGAFGTGEMPLLPRLLYWIPICALGGALALLMGRLQARLPHWRGHPYLELALFALIMSVPLTLLVWGVTAAFFGAQIGPADLLVLFPQVLLITLGMTILNGLIHRPKPAAGAAGEKPVRFLERLPLPLRAAKIYAVEAEDHYLRVHTDKGTELILLRLADAVAELEGLDGAQTHRSWWVAREAITEVKRGDGRATLTLKSGVQAPVSRAYAKGLRQAGWI